MFPAFAFALMLNVQQPAGPPPTTSAPTISETTPVEVPSATPTALRYYTSGNWLWVLDQVLSIALLAVILFSGFSAKLRSWAQRIGRNWFFTTVVYVALFTIVTFVIALPLHLLRGVRAPARLRPLESDTAEMVDRLADGAGGELRRRRTVPVGAVSAAAQEPAAMVAVHGRCRHSVHRRRQSHRADLDRTALQPLRTDERQGAGDADPGAGGSCGHRRQPRIRGQQERRYENAECVCRRPLADQADCPVGHDHRAHGRSRAAVRHGPRDGTLRPRARLAAAGAHCHF